MILLLHMRIHLIASSISIIMTLAPITMLILHLGFRTLPIQSVVVITFNKFHDEVLGNLLFGFVT